MNGAGRSLALPLAALLAFAAVLFAHAGLPVLGDYGEWSYHGALLRDVLAGHADAAYQLKHYPVPNSLTTVALGLLMTVLPWVIAAKLWLLAEAGLGLVCAWMLNRASPGRDGWMLWVLPGGVLFGIDFWAGFSNFLFGVYFAMLFCALLLRGSRSRRVLSLLLVLVFFSHMIPFGFCCLALVFFAWQTRRPGLLWAMLPGLLLTFWYLAGRFLGQGDADAQAGMEDSTRYLSRTFLAFKANTYLKGWGLINPGLGALDSVGVRVLGEPVFAALVVLDIGLGLLLLWLFWKNLRRAFKERTPDRFLWGTVAVFCCIFPAMPGALAGISDPGGRMLQVAVWAALVASATTRRWQGPALAVAATGLLASNLWLFATVAFQPSALGVTTGRLPERVRLFGHVYFADRAGYPARIDRGPMDLPIYPTALFLKRPESK